MRIYLIIGIVVIASILIAIGIFNNYNTQNLDKTINAIIGKDENPEFNNKFIIDGIELSELYISVKDNDILKAIMNDNHTMVKAYLKTNNLDKDYKLIFDNHTLEFKRVDNMLMSEYYNVILPKSIIIKDIDTEINLKPFIKEVINNELYYYELKIITINNERIIVEIADDNKKRELGLMYRENMFEKGGMLFILESNSKPSFWMMNMLISLDIIWIDEHGKIVDITKYAKPCNNDILACTYKPKDNIKYVLEVNAGFTDKYNIKEGQVIRIEDI